MKKNKFILTSNILLLLAAFIIFSAFAAAEYTEELHDNWHYSNETFIVNGKNVTLLAGSSQDTVMIDYDGERLIVTNKTCEETDKYFFCVDSTKTGGFDYYWRVDILQYEIRILAKKAKIEISRDIDSTELLFGETATIKLYLKNTGSFTASEVHFEDIFPGMRITDADGCNYGEDTIIWDGTILPERTVTCTYKITPEENNEIKSTAKASYNDGHSSVEASSSEITITAIAEELLVGLPDELSLELDSNQDIFITLNNTASRIIKIKSAQLQIQYGLKATNYKQWTKIHDYKFSYSGDLLEKSSLPLNITFTAERVRDYIVYFYVDYDAGTFSRQIERSMNISVSMPEPVINPGTLEFVSGKKASFSITLENPSEIHSFEQVDTKIEIDCLNISYSKAFSKLEASSLQMLFSDIIDLPKSDDNLECNLEVQVEYETAHGQKFTLSNSTAFTIFASESELEESQLLEESSNLQAEDANNTEDQAVETVVVDGMSATNKASTIAEKIANLAKSNVTKYVGGFLIFIVLVSIIFKVISPKKTITKEAAQKVLEEIQAPVKTKKQSEKAEKEILADEIEDNGNDGIDNLGSREEKLPEESVADEKEQKIISEPELIQNQGISKKKKTKSKPAKKERIIKEKKAKNNKKPKKEEVFRF